MRYVYCIGCKYKNNERQCQWYCWYDKYDDDRFIAGSFKRFFTWAFIEECVPSWVTWALLALFVMALIFGE